MPFGSPQIKIDRRATDRLRAGHLWVYRSDISEHLSSTPPGSLVTVLDPRRSPLGTALYSGTSQIALRIISPLPDLSREQYLADTRARVEAALSLREQLAPLTEAHRLVFAEADNLPGIVIDRYGPLAIVQLLTQGTAQDDLRALLAEVLPARLPIETVIERPDSRIRELEDLPATPTEPLFSRHTEPQLQTVFTLNGLRFHFDASSGQKTGAFLDQRLNYAAAAHYAHGHALDICTYQGGYALHLATRCSRVTGVDASRAALEVAERNLTINPQITSPVNWIEADAFDLLRDFDSDSSQRRYDTIVLDPPAFAKSKRAAEAALRGYKELNLRALRLLRPGGILVTCSCSHHVSLAEFTTILASAAADAGRSVQLLETRGAAPDHPAILTLPETSYLKCLIARVR